MAARRTLNVVPRISLVCRLSRCRSGPNVTLAGWFHNASDYRMADGCPPRVSEVISPWFVGPVGWVLRERTWLPTPVPCKGAQGLWTLPPDVQRGVDEQLAIVDLVRASEVSR